LIWREHIEEKSFNMLKDAVRDAVDRHGFDPDQAAILESDASHNGGGCVIKQKDAAGKEQVILYDAFTFTQAEKRYGTFKKELAAVIRFIKRWHCYLGAIRGTVVRTDHRPLLGFQPTDVAKDDSGVHLRRTLLFTR
jgi:hypothetical protein